MTAAFFCEQTGRRIVAPGVCKAVDPDNGQAEFSEPAPVADSPTSTSNEPAPVAEQSAPRATRRS